MQANKGAPTDSGGRLLNLKATMARLRVRTEDLAAVLIQQGGHDAGQPLSRSAVSRMIGGTYRPAATPWDYIVRATEAYLKSRGASAADIDSLWLASADTKADAADTAPFVYPEFQIEAEMLTPAAKRHFSLFVDPFQNDVRSSDDIFLSPDQRYIREAMYQAAKQDGWMIAIVGESGSGKTTLRRDVKDRLTREGDPVLFIEPQSFDKTTLNARHISEAILADVAPSASPKRSLEALARQVRAALVESSRAGNRHLLMIEEAHDLNISTLKYLKRFWEMEDGFRKLLSIVLIGQPELKSRLNERQYSEAREVIRRIEVAELLPLDGQLGDYLALKMRRVGKALVDICQPEAIDAMRERLTLVGRGQSRNATISMAYPLVVNNLLTKAMNEAAHLGAERVTADIIRGLQ